ncbi:related to cdc24-gtp gdp exchange factor forcdc42p [Lichtheimia corymbifera JMRC:FSU:9682]|uniref:Related to cdc24-gtp gdp exchange factor forcdc42p n=1 Tax=Lichtheimia corymbifera JMRC:FSU:9682 TaxID=1263082 RepID=A0A068S5M9_9FUNG|nr:related to cdc24-gtp gdp exchange factor forcdc42p [Lichtheimia corymbifera JMRC:FSU:9682]
MAVSSTIYQRCRSVLDGLAAVPGCASFGIQRLSETNISNGSNAEIRDDYIPRPFYHLWKLCRDGAILNHLCNLLEPQHAIDVQSCKKNKKPVYRFITVCQNHLNLREDELFTISEMYKDNTNTFVKVINTLNKLLILLNERGILISEYPPPAKERPTPSSLRDKVIFELLDTERKYVHDLETMQNYAKELGSILSLNTVHHIFSNLSALVDFQLRFLLYAEYHAEFPNQSSFGQCIVNLEDAFSVYEPYCANLQHALDLVIQWTPQMTSTSIEPTYELPSYLIKPVQRVCKYPLLMEQLIKNTPEDWPHYNDLEQAMEAIQRVAFKVNETRRTQENKQRVKELKERVSDWRGVTDVDKQCGALLLHDRVYIHQSNSIPRQVAAHLFEKTIVLCVESTKKTKKKKDGMLDMLGLIGFGGIVQVIDSNELGKPLSLQIFFSSVKDGQFDLETFTMEFLNDERLAQWETAIKKQAQKAARRRPLTRLVIGSSPSTPIPQQQQPHPSTQDYDHELLSPTFVSYASMNRLPIRGPYYEQFADMLSEESHYHHGNDTLPSPPSPSYSTSRLHAHQLPPSPPQTGCDPATSPSIVRHHHHYYHHHPGPLSPMPTTPTPFNRQENGYDGYSGIRNRSQSSPNLHFHAQPQPQYQNNSTAPQAVRTSSTVRVKLHYSRNGTFVFYAPRNINLHDLRVLAERKTRVNNLGGDYLKYRDEEGDLVTINSDEDIALAFDSAPSDTAAVHLYISYSS